MSDRDVGCRTYYPAPPADGALAQVGATYIAVYVITRANKQLKVYVELVEPGLLNEAEMQVRISAELLKNLLTETGRVALPEVSAAAGEAGLDTEFDTEILQSVVELLAAQPSLRLYVVAHSGVQVSPLAEQMASSVSRAQELVAALVAAPVRGRHSHFGCNAHKNDLIP